MQVNAEISMSTSASKQAFFHGISVNECGLIPQYSDFFLFFLTAAHIA